MLPASPSPSPRDRHKWTPEQDQRLSDVVTEGMLQCIVQILFIFILSSNIVLIWFLCKVSKPGQSISWHKVASHIPGRSNKDCRKRWHYKIAHHFKQGPWTSEEDNKLRHAVLMHGTKWTKVSEEVGSRNGDQCWKRWHDNLNPEIDHSPWTEDEVKQTPDFPQTSE